MTTIDLAMHKDRCACAIQRARKIIIPNYAYWKRSHERESYTSAIIHS
jgi:hypothetical protein